MELQPDGVRVAAYRQRRVRDRGRPRPRPSAIGQKLTRGGPITVSQCGVAQLDCRHVGLSTVHAGRQVRREVQVRQERLEHRGVRRG
jgi:hypothetical protein